MSRRYTSRRYAGGLGPSRVRTRIPTTRRLGQRVSLRKIIRFRVRLQLSQSHCLSLLLAMSGRVFLFFPPRGQPLTPSFSNIPLCQTPGCHVRFPSGWCFSTLGPRAGFFTLDCCCCWLLLIHTFSVLSLQLKKLRWHNKSAIDLSNANPACGHKEVRRSTGHIMVTTRYSDQQGSKSRQKVMRLYKQWHRPISKGFIKPPYSIREQPRSTRNVVAYPRPAFSAKNRKNYAPTSFDQQVQVSQGHTFCTEIRKIEIPRSMVVEALNWWSRRASQHPAVQSPVHSWKSPTILARSPLLVALVGRKMTVVRDQLFPQKPPGSSLWFSRTGVQPSPGSSTIELPSAFAESGAYPPDSRVLPGSPRQCSLPLACRHPPEGHQIGAREEARTWEHHHPQPTIPPPRLNRQAESRRQPVGCISWGWARPYTRRKDPPTLIPRNQQVSEGAGTR